MSDSETLYEQLGGRASIAAVVDRFYERVLADESLEEFFDGVDTQRLRAHQTSFLCAATGGPTEYTGESVREAHAHLDLTEAHFESVAAHLQTTLEEFDVTERHVDAVMETVGGLKSEVLA
ncbi:MAG: group I truncated hemoglobin [Halobacteriota archaeon]